MTFPRRELPRLNELLIPDDRRKSTRKHLYNHIIDSYHLHLSMPAVTSSIHLPIATYPITWGDNSMPVLGLGRFGCVVKLGEDRVLKRPKTFPEIHNPDISYINEANIICLANEANVYKRLGRHDGIIQCFQTSSYSIELAFANQGDLFTYMQNNPRPTEAVIVDWIRSLAETFAYIHSRRVVVEDIGLKNILVHNNCLKLVDFGNSLLLPMDTDMECFCIQDITPRLEVLHLGCVFYSLATWIEFKYDYIDPNHMLKPDQCPKTAGIIGESIILKCWTGGYASMESLKKDVKALLG
ncbi:serine/threonine protein kinase [Trichophyton rubrum D6]|uniref:Protein kinase domain-containing protein n=4 Tax=Trichophyton TaxID=5550 RepID=A0A178ET95_TRIRU|nr:serine/threonine protein kinase [Trichophyton rubrum CBS 118892]EZF09710.1 serine/threonine protein kinase [Trichophyton rubrum MR850]EZF36539.1 serine/threonine protein kinase [Trichophyton rubrum CBS 100081]EZF47217.1 serine/threonine protein kinase [Trichophyton rubrum CBS 288.86]EZF57899.1 serine/threonine protein kinase [Trichophyton rubrum CBS 289.86]EZF68487.1 serine/threonine protein kinase [Trichophyton soudanense CBS 452.61]EZF79190.1 serine/threonine protein kinase [Trichophyton